MKKLEQNKITKEFETKHFKIRKFNQEDVKAAHENIGTVEVLADCLDFNVHTNIEETKAMVYSSISEFESGEMIWAIENKNENKVIGYININQISEKNKICELKFCINPNYFEQTENLEDALTKVIGYLFKERKFEIITSKVYDGNEKILKMKEQVFKSIGMIQEATLRKRKISRTTGKSENLYIFSIIKEEFENFSRQN